MPLKLSHEISTSDSIAWLAFRQMIEEMNGVLRAARSPQLSGDDFSHYLTVCDRFFGRLAVTSTLQSYLASLRRADHVAGSSFEHENGFTKICLWRFEGGEQLRLHIWPKAEHRDSRMHSHRWNLLSYVVKGHITAVNYAESHSLNATQFHALRLFDAVDGVKKVEELKTLSIEPVQIYTVSEGAGHYLDYRTIHRVAKPGGVEAITLMLTGRPASDHSIFIEGEAVRPKSRSFMEAKMIDEVTRSVLASLARSE